MLCLEVMPGGVVLAAPAQGLVPRLEDQGGVLARVDHHWFPREPGETVVGHDVSSEPVRSRHIDTGLGEHLADH